MEWSCLECLFKILSLSRTDTIMDNTRLKLFGRRVRELRIQKGFSQESFAHDCEMARSFYGDVERGNRNITILNIFKIADGLGVEPFELFHPPTE